MVLPTAAHKAPALPSSAATPDRSLYEAGKGHILNHFADIVTPADTNSNNNRSDARHARALGAGGARTRARRSLDGLNGDVPSAQSDVHMDSACGNNDGAAKDYTYVSTADRDMEDALFGARAGNNNSSEHEALSQQEKLEQWRRSKDRASGAATAGNRISAHASAKATHSVQQQPPKRPKAAHTSKAQQHSPPRKPSAASVSTTASTAFAESNQSHESDRSTAKMFTMDYSPPRRSRRATVEVDPSTAAAALASSGSDKQQQQSKTSGKASGTASFSASFVSGSEPFSPAVSHEFLTRDLEEEDQALNAQSDRDRAFLYKKRYSDTYGYAVMLARRVMRLERQRADRNAEIDVLRSKVRTQEQIIRAMSQPETASSLGASVQEQQVQSLCREVGALVQQLGERDSIIKTLHTERDECVRVLNDLKLSRAACQAGECVHSSSNDRSRETSVQAPERPSATRVAELEGVIDSLHDQVAAMRTAFDDLADEKRALEDQLAVMQDKYDDSQHLYAAAEAKREALSSGLEQAHEQLGALHAQWTQEKAELLQSASCDATTAANVAAERDRLRAENAALTSSLSKANASERKVAAQLAQQQAATAQAQAQTARLERELDAARVQVAALTEREKQLVRVEVELERTKQDAAVKAERIAALEHEMRMKDDEVRAADARFLEKTVYMEKRLFDAEIIRRRLHNKVMELKGNIRVFCRVRPVLAHERSAAGNEEIFAFPDSAGERRQIELTANSKSHVSYGQNGGRDAVKKYSFDFDLVFDSTCSQEDVFLEVSALVQSALDGYNVCIFAYGQTGSGKTFTMQGREDSAGYATMQPSSHMGIVGRAIAHIYATIADLRSSGWDFGVTLEMIEIYNETLRDLLAPPGTADKVDLRLDGDGRPAIANSCVHPVVNELDAWQLLCKAMTRRSTKATSMNDRSSRSHCVITFRMTGVNSLTGDRRVGVVHLVDLAGSERLNKSGSGNDRELLKEAQAINKSLSSLGNVICALAKKSAHVPFRDSKLTHFLSPSLGGDSKTLMICNLSPLKQHRDETLNSLRFAKTVNSCEITYASVSSRS